MNRSELASNLSLTRDEADRIVATVRPQRGIRVRGLKTGPDCPPTVPAGCDNDAGRCAGVEPVVLTVLGRHHQNVGHQHPQPDRYANGVRR